jgi:hypothetical protein
MQDPYAPSIEWDIAVIDKIREEVPMSDDQSAGLNRIREHLEEYHEALKG